MTASNLNVVGDQTYIRTGVFKTDNLEIITDHYSGTSLTVVQRGTQDVANFNNRLIIKNDGKIGIGTQPAATLHISSNIKISGNTQSVTAAELGFLKGTGSNIQKQISNINTYGSNYTSNVSKSLSDNLTLTSNNLVTNITSLNSIQSNVIDNINKWPGQAN